MDAQECNSSTNVPTHETVGSTTGGKRKQVNETNNDSTSKKKGEKFVFEETPMVKNWIFKKMCKKFGDWKHMLKQHYDKYDTDEDRRENVPVGVSSEEWEVLMLHFSDPEVQEVSAQNKANRSKQTLNHRTGSKSYAQIRAEEAEKDPEHRSPTQWKMFCISQRRKDGTMGSSYAQELMDKFNDLSSSQAEGSESVNEDELYHKIIGPERHGRVRTYGLGPTPSSLFGGTPGRTELLTRLEESDKHNEAISVQFQELSKEVDDLKKNGEEERKKMEEERKKLEEGLKKVEEERKRMDEDRRMMQESFEKLMQEERKRNTEFINTMMKQMTSKSGPSKRLERFSMSK